MSGGIEKIFVGREQGQVMPNAKLRKQRVNRTHLNASATTAVTQSGSINVILPVGADKRQCRKSLDDGQAGAWAIETLKQFLQNKPGRYDNLVTVEGIAQRAHLRGQGFVITPESE